MNHGCILKMCMLNSIGIIPCVISLLGFVIVMLDVYVKFHWTTLIDFGNILCVISSLGFVIVMLELQDWCVVSLRWQFL